MFGERAPARSYPALLLRCTPRALLTVHDHLGEGVELDLNLDPFLGAGGEEGNCPRADDQAHSHTSSLPSAQALSKYLLEASGSLSTPCSPSLSRMA